MVCDIIQNFLAEHKWFELDAAACDQIVSFIQEERTPIYTFQFARLSHMQLRYWCVFGISGPMRFKELQNKRHDFVTSFFLSVPQCGVP
jgi:hypothetical protein